MYHRLAESITDGNIISVPEEASQDAREVERGEGWWSRTYMGAFPQTQRDLRQHLGLTSLLGNGGSKEEILFPPSHFLSLPAVIHSSNRSIKYLLCAKHWIRSW